MPRPLMLAAMVAEIENPTSGVRFSALMRALTREEKEIIATYVRQMVFVPMPRH